MEDRRHSYSQWMKGQVDNRSELPIYGGDGITLFLMFICIIKNIVHRLDHCSQNWFDVASVDLVMVFDAILTSRQTREKLQCLYENLMSNKFQKTAVLKNI